VSAKESSLFTTLGTGLVQRVAVAGLVTKTAVTGRQKVILEAVLVRINAQGKSLVWKFYSMEGLLTPIILGSD